jgi:hypothetical protein
MRASAEIGIGWGGELERYDVRRTTTLPMADIAFFGLGEGFGRRGEERLLPVTQFC